MAPFASHFAMMFDNVSKIKELYRFTGELVRNTLLRFMAALRVLARRSTSRTPSSHFGALLGPFLSLLRDTVPDCTDPRRAHRPWREVFKSMSLNRGCTITLRTKSAILRPSSHQFCTPFLLAENRTLTAVLSNSRPAASRWDT